MEPKDEIKQKTEISELIGEYLDLKPAGGGSFKTLCPFHGEKTPSFFVSSEKQIWHCFGCGEGGDCFEFVMKMEGMDFPEALRHLGKKVGVEIKRFSSAQSNENQRVLAINDLASKFFQKVLHESSTAQNARKYLEDRGITQSLQEKFNLGFAPDNWDSLEIFLSNRGYKGAECQKAGLLLQKKSGSGFVDRFRNRIMIPLFDHHGNTIGFTGRLLPGADEKAGGKYMNSPETSIYHKGRILYGLDLAKKAIKEKGNVVVVEGNLDVIASHKAGVENVVASSGTALTQDQLELLKRFTTTIIFSLDADAAGFTAAQRGIKTARALGFDIRAAILPAESGKDPDEAIQKDPLIWQNAVEETKPIMEYFIDQAIKEKNLKDVDHKKQVARLLIPALSDIVDVIEREHWLQVVSDLLHTNIDSVRSALHPATAVKQTLEDKHVNKERKAVSKEEHAARLLIGISINNKTLCKDIIIKLDGMDLYSPELSCIYKNLKEEYNQVEDLTQKTLFNRLRDRLEASKETKAIPLLDSICLKAEQFIAVVPENKVSEQLEQLLALLTNSKLAKKRKQLEADIRQAEQAGDVQTAQKLISEFNDLTI
ncbi:MAG: DNA primase [Patescibacteria group bacterium]